MESNTVFFPESQNVQISNGSSLKQQVLVMSGFRQGCHKKKKKKDEKKDKTDKDRVKKLKKKIKGHACCLWGNQNGKIGPNNISRHLTRSLLTIHVCRILENKLHFPNIYFRLRNYLPHLNSHQAVSVNLIPSQTAPCLHRAQIKPPPCPNLLL